MVLGVNLHRLRGDAVLCEPPGALADRGGGVTEAEIQLRLERHAAFLQYLVIYGDLSCSPGKDEIENFNLV